MHDHETGLWMATGERGRDGEAQNDTGERRNAMSILSYSRRVGSFRSMIICGVGGAALGAKKSRAWYVSMVDPEPPAAHAMKGVE